MHQEKWKLILTINIQFFIIAKIFQKHEWKSGTLIINSETLLQLNNFKQEKDSQ